MSMMEKNIICITCPQGCTITVKGDPEAKTIESVTGNKCKRGQTYAESEFIHPVRILTSSVKAVGCSVPVVAVRTAKPIPKELLFAGMDEIRKLTIKDTVHSGDVLVVDFLGTGVPLIVAGSAEKL